MSGTTPQRDVWNGHPVALGIAWTLKKRDHVAQCLPFSHQFGWELRLEVGELFRTQVCRSTVAIPTRRSPGSRHAGEGLESPRVRHSEQLAQTILELLRPDIRVRPVTTQSHGEWDLDLLDGDGVAVGMVEVTTADMSVRRTDAAIEREPIIKLPRARYRWYINPLVGFDLKNLRKKIDEYLVHLESQGITYFNESMALDICRDLQLQSGYTVGTEAAEVVLHPPGRGTWVSPEQTVHAVEAEATKPDNRRKLAAHPHVRERHLFVVIADRNHGPRVGMMEEPSQSVPRLPADITHVWTVARRYGWHEPPWYLVWRALNGQPFFAVAHVKADN